MKLSYAFKSFFRASPTHVQSDSYVSTVAMNKVDEKHDMKDISLLVSTCALGRYRAGNNNILYLISKGLRCKGVDEPVCKWIRFMLE